MQLNGSTFSQAILVSLSLLWFGLAVHSCSNEKSQNDIEQTLALGKSLQSRHYSNLRVGNDYARSLSDDNSYDVQKHVLKPGETLRDVALQYGTDWQTILRANTLSDSTQLRAGQTILVPIPKSSGQWPRR